MTKKLLPGALAGIACLCALPAMVGLAGCASERHNPRTGQQISGDRTAESSSGQITDQRVEDSRTAGRVREALAAGSEYKHEGVKVIACNGVVQLSGFVNTSTQRDTAGEVARKVVGVKAVENNLAVRD